MRRDHDKIRQVYPSTNQVILRYKGLMGCQNIETSTTQLLYTYRVQNERHLKSDLMLSYGHFGVQFSGPTPIEMDGSRTMSSDGMFRVFSSSTLDL